jgi:hypothetical protein
MRKKERENGEGWKRRLQKRKGIMDKKGKNKWGRR